MTAIRRGDIVRTASGRVYVVEVPRVRGFRDYRLATLSPRPRPFVNDEDCARRGGHAERVELVATVELDAAWLLLWRVGRHFKSGVRWGHAGDLALAAKQLANAAARGDDDPRNIAAARAELERLQTLNVEV